MTGTRPVVDFMFLDFILDAFGELINQIAKMQYMSSGSPENAHRSARLHWRRRRGRHPSLGQLLSDLYASARLQGRGAV